MAGIYPFYYNRVAYYLRHKTLGTLRIEEPEGWNDDEKEYARNKQYDGIFPKFSNNLKFIGDGKDFINTARAIDGINAKVQLVKEYLDEDLIWQRAYTCALTMPTREQEDGKVAIKCESGGLESTLKARRSDKVELERLTSISGVVIPPLQTIKVNYHGRRIFLKSQWDFIPTSDQANVSVETNAGNTRSDVGGIPLNLWSKSHDFAQSPLSQSDGDENNGSAEIMFMRENDRDRLLSIKLNVAFNAFFQQYENVQWCRYKLCLTTYKDGNAYNLKERRVLRELRSENPAEAINSSLWLPSDTDFAVPQFNLPMAGSFDDDITLLAGESLALEVYLKSDMYVDNNAGVRVFATGFSGFLTVEEDSSYPATQADAVLAYEFLAREVLIMTGKSGLFKSDYYGRASLGYPVDGPGAFTAINHGHWLRRFSQADRLYKPIATSFKESIEAFEVPHNIGVGIEYIGNKERIIVEDKKFFYQPIVTIRIGEYDADGVFRYAQVQKVKRREVEDYYFNSVNIGSEKGGDYEEVMGLEETNTSANFTTPIEAVVNAYEKISKWHLDTYGPEIIRRRGIETAPTTDFSEDTELFMNSVKPGPGGIWDLKRNTDVLQGLPTGMFSPETSYNFEYSPVNCLLKHGWVIMAGLTKNLLDNLVFGSSRGHSEVTMQLNGQNAYAENGNVPIQHLQKPRFVAEEIEFEATISNELLRIIEGHTVIEGKKIPNFYGLVEFLNEDGVLERGFIDSVKPEKEGKWKLLNSYR